MARPKKNPATVDKVCEQCNKPYAVKYVKRFTQRFCSKVCAGACVETKRKIVDSQSKVYSEKYGGSHPMQTEVVKSNFKKSMIEKYGVSSALKLDKFMVKADNTRILRYGDANYNNYEQIKKTCLERYGVDNFRKTAEFNIKYKKTCLEKYGTSHASKSVDYKLSHKLSMFKKFLGHDRFKNFTTAFSIDEYDGVTTRFNKKYPFTCVRCGLLENHFINDGKWPKCSSCDKQFSEFQTEVQDFVKEILKDTPVNINDRSVLHPQEVDIYIPSISLGIECDSLCFHSELFGYKNKTYHLNKTKGCSIKGIRLVHVWDSEWNHKKDVVKSILRNMINKNFSSIPARKCSIQTISSKISAEFLNKNHIQGVDRSSVKIGLFYKDVLVSVMTFCESRFNKKIDWELSRFCNILNTNVIGGASRLFKHFIKTYNPTNVISYSDRRYFIGSIYLNLGFEFLDNTPPSYHYIVDNYSTTKNRLAWQKHKLKDKLEGFDPNLTEWENMKNHGHDRIWDCGHSKWIYSTIK